MKTENTAKVALQKSVDLKGAVMVIVGCQVGSGIFVSPKGVLEHTNSPGLCLIVWALGGLLAGLGSMVYAELACGTLNRYLTRHNYIIDSSSEIYHLLIK
jgi:amino acid transporter